MSEDEWTPGKWDRITAEGGDIDEIVLSNVTVHLERMNDQRYYLGIYGPGDFLVQASVACARGRRKRTTAYVYTLDVPDSLPVDDDAWMPEIRERRPAPPVTDTEAGRDA